MHGMTAHAASQGELLGEIDYEEQMKAEILEGIEENIRLKDSLAYEFEQLDSKFETLNFQMQEVVASLERNNQEYDVYAADCSITVHSDEEEQRLGAQCNQRYDRLQDRRNYLNKKREGLGEQASRLSSEEVEINKKEEMRAYAAQQWTKQLNQKEITLGELYNQLDEMATETDECSAMSSMEAMHCCMRSVWDGTSPSECEDDLSDIPPFRMP